MKNHPRLKRWLVRTGVLVGLVALLVLVAVLAQAIVATRKLKSCQAQLEQDAIPLSWPELHQQFPNVEAHLAAQSHFFAALDSLTNLPRLPTEPFHGERFAYMQDGNAGTLSFSCPDSEDGFTFKVFAGKESPEPEH